MHRLQRCLFVSFVAVLCGFGAAAVAQDVTYTYDDLGRLKSIDHSTGQSVDYEYDAAGNRTTVQTLEAPSTLSVNDATGSEGGNVTFTVTRAGNTASAVTVDYATSDGTALAASDYTSATNTLSFLATETTKTVNIAATDDATFEMNEGFTLTLSNPGLSASITDATGDGTIVDNDGGPAFSVNDVSITEGGSLSFTVTKSGSTTQTHNVSYATTNGTASSGSDYTGVSGTLIFAPADVTKTVTVTTSSDSTYENNETVALNLSNATNSATISDSQGVGTINNDDSGPAFSINDVSVTEGGTLSFTVSKSGSTAFSHNVSYATANGTANGSDYTSKSGTLTFTSGQTSKSVTVSTTQDSNYEANETLALNLSSATSGATISDSQGVGTINNDDSPIVYVRNSAGVLQSGYTQSTTYNWRLGYIHKTKAGSTVIHSAVNALDGPGYCDTSVAPISGYSWTGNSCEMRVD